MSISNNIPIAMGPCHAGVNKSLAQKNIPVIMHDDNTGATLALTFIFWSANGFWCSPIPRIQRAYVFGMVRQTAVLNPLPIKVVNRACQGITLAILRSSNTKNVQKENH